MPSLGGCASTRTLSACRHLHGANNTIVKDNVSYNNGDHGIDVLNSTNTVIVANTIYHNVTAGINLEGGKGTTASSGGTVAKIFPSTRNDGMPWWSSSVTSANDSARRRASASVSMRDA